MPPKLTIQQAFDKLINAPNCVDYKYPYFYSEYNNTHSKITVTCQKHGEFTTTYTSLIHQSTGCPKCSTTVSANKGRIDANQAFADINKAHNYQYTYPHFFEEYFDNNSRITAECSVHGKFDTSRNIAINSGVGCKLCSYENFANKRRFTPNQVIENLYNVHGDRYQFPDVVNEYTGNKSKITAICAIHGAFTTTYANLVCGGTGCPRCAGKILPTLEELLLILNTLYSGKYQYPHISSEYVGTDSIISVLCPSHGLFKKSYSNLIYNKSGCLDCARVATINARRNVIGLSGLCDYDRYHSQLPITDDPTEGPHGELQVRCKMCQQLMVPTYTQVAARIRVINTVNQGESNFYCSDRCKSECTTYHKVSRFTSHSDHEAKVKLARNCQLETKRILRQHQMDQYGHHFCEKCGKVVDNPELHHTIEVAKDPSGAITIAGQMLVCGECHKEFTRICR